MEHRLLNIITKTCLTVTCICVVLTVAFSYKAYQVRSKTAAEMKEYRATMLALDLELILEKERIHRETLEELAQVFKRMDAERETAAPNRAPI